MASLDRDRDNCGLSFFPAFSAPMTPGRAYRAPSPLPEVVERCVVAAERPLRCDKDDWGLSFFSVSPGQNQLFLMLL
jgi:hypothetical protein